MRATTAGLYRKAELQKALDFSEVAKKADKSECYRASLTYYEAALEAYLSVLKSTPTPHTHRRLNPHRHLKA